MMDEHNTLQRLSGRIKVIDFGSACVYGRPMQIYIQASLVIINQIESCRTRTIIILSLSIIHFESYLSCTVEILPRTGGYSRHWVRPISQIVKASFCLSLCKFYLCMHLACHYGETYYNVIETTQFLFVDFCNLEYYVTAGTRMP